MNIRSTFRFDMASALPNTNRELDLISIDHIIDNPYQPRNINVKGDDFEELKNSIKFKGLDNPILVIRKGIKGTSDYYRFILIQGQRRLQAIKELEHQSILANILEYNEDFIKKQLPIHSLLENIQRRNLHFLDELKAIYLVANDNLEVFINDGDYYQNNEKISVLKLSDQLYDFVYIKSEYLRKKLSLYLLLHENQILQDEILNKGYKLQDLLSNKRIREKLFAHSSNSTSYTKSNNYKAFQRTLTKLQNIPELNHFYSENNIILPINPINDFSNIPKQQLKLLKKTINQYLCFVSQYLKGGSIFD